MRAFLASVCAIISVTAIFLLVKPELALGDQTRQFLSQYGQKMFAVLWFTFVISLGGSILLLRWDKIPRNGR